MDESGTEHRIPARRNIGEDDEPPGYSSLELRALHLERPPSYFQSPCRMGPAGYAFDIPRRKRPFASTDEV